MAAKPKEKMLQVTVNFDGSRTVLHLPFNMKVGRAIEKAAEHFNVKPGGLTFLYRGLEVTDDMTVGTALSQANTSTVIHLIKVSSKKPNTASVRPADRETVFAHCKRCEGLVLAREIFLCPGCRHNGLFLRSVNSPINHFATTVNPAFLRGSCSNCSKDDLQAHIQFDCVPCSMKESVPVVPLRQVRDNTRHNIKCMKCGNYEEEVFRFACSSRHCVCLECFQKWCQHQMNASCFRQFGESGYSVGCPGPGADCSHTPVPDPHHFKLVDEEGKFYKKFIDKSIVEFTPPGNDVFCHRCSIIVNTGNSSEVEVKEPEGATPSAANISGLRWYQKLLWSKPEPPPQPTPRKRSRTSCSRCSLQYCVACKQIWHEGDCRKIDEALKREEKEFPIDPAMAKASCWPQNED